MSERPTPETDAAIIQADGRWTLDLKAKMQDIERERDEARERVAKLENALRKIAAIQNCYDGGDWDEIENARLIANEVLAFSKPQPPTFTAHGRVWITHTPGDPMPCDGAEYLRILCREGEYDDEGYPAGAYAWCTIPKVKGAEIIGWNYADPSKEVRA